MTIDDLAKRLGFSLVLTFRPKMENPDKSYEFIPDPKPWTCRRLDSYSDCTGKGASSEEACAALAESILEAARKNMAREAESHVSSAQYLGELLAKLGTEGLSKP
jgi:hypothetical protein